MIGWTWEEWLLAIVVLALCLGVPVVALVLAS